MDQQPHMFPAVSLIAIEIDLVADPHLDAQVLQFLGSIH
jgi:hypothetical protein